MDSILALMNFSVVNFLGNGEAMLDFERFYLNTKHILYNYLYHHTRDFFELEDIAQETYLSALEQWDMLKNHPNPAGWLIVTAKHLNFNYERHIVSRLEQLSCPNDIPYIEPAYNALVMEDLLENVYCKKEQELVKNDWEKSKTMMKFYSYENLNSLSNSFVEK